MQQSLVIAVLSPLIVALVSLVRAAAPQDASGFEGTILMSPVHGGPAAQGIPNDGPLPNTEFVVKKGDAIVGSFTTNEQGQFRINLAPGHYTVEKKGIKQRKIGFYGPFEVEVAQGRIAQVKWICGTGML
jgi:hypothetical protein